MAKCANCSSDAVHFIRNEPYSDVDYCDACLPRALRQRVKAGEKFPEPKKAVSKAASDE